MDVPSQAIESGPAGEVSQGREGRLAGEDRPALRGMRVSLGSSIRNKTVTSEWLAQAEAFAEVGCETVIGDLIFALGLDVLATTMPESPAEVG